MMLKGGIIVNNYLTEMRMEKLSTVLGGFNGLQRKLREAVHASEILPLISLNVPNFGDEKTNQK